MAEPEALFADEWWTVPEGKYQEACLSLKVLALKDLDVGSKDVRIFVLC